jgi:putative copper export protein
MPILLAGTIEFVHIEQVSALFTFHLGKVLLYKGSGIAQHSD